MNMKLMKKVLATTLAATLLVAPAITAGATTDSSSAPTPSATAPAATAPAATSSTSSGGGSQSTPEPSAVERAGSVSVAGTVIKSDVAGAYWVKTLAGVAVRQSSATIKTAAGLANNETPFVRAYDITAKKSPAAFASFEGAAAAVGGTVLGAVNIDLGKLADRKFSSLDAGVKVPTTIGVANANGRTLAVVKVVPGGATEILQDQDDNPDTVTFDIQGGLAAYAVIAF